MLDVVGVAGDGVVQVVRHAQGVQALDEGVGARLVGVLGYDDAADEEAQALENVHQAQDILIVSDAQVAAYLAFLDVVGVNRNDDLHIVAHAGEHADLGVGGEAGKNAGRMVVVEELSAELKVELSAELGDAFLDVLGLH